MDSDFDFQNRITARVTDLERRLSALEDNMFYKGHRAVPKEINLPDNLYKTWRALKKGSMTASEMSQITDRARTDESKYLNTLALIGLARKQRNGRKVVFTLIQKSEQ